MKCRRQALLHSFNAAVVVVNQVFNELRHEVFDRIKFLKIKQFSFKQAKEVFHHSIAQAVALAAHVLANAFGFAHPLVLFVLILSALAGVKVKQYVVWNVCKRLLQHGDRPTLPHLRLSIYSPSALLPDKSFPLAYAAVPAYPKHPVRLIVTWLMLTHRFYYPLLEPSVVLLIGFPFGICNHPQSYFQYIILLSFGGAVQSKMNTLSLYGKKRASMASRTRCSPRLLLLSTDSTLSSLSPMTIRSITGHAWINGMF